MNISSLERTVLVRYKQHRDVPPTAFQLLTRLSAKTIGMLILYPIAIALVAALGFHFAALFLAGYLVAMIALRFETAITFVRLWPLVSTIIDWRKVDELLAAADPNEPSH